MLRRIPQIVTVLSAVFWISFIQAENDVYIPESLEPWVDWVLDDNPHFACPIRATDGVRLNCIWVRETNIEVLRGQTFGAKFELKVHAFAESTLQLPYGQSFKPQNVTLNGQEIALGGGNSAPEVLVPLGSHSIVGDLVWTEETEPRFLEIPRSGIVRLAIDGESVAHPSLRGGGSRLWFSNEIKDTPTTTTTPDSEFVRVFRHFIDDIPQTLTTYIEVTITGNPRTIDFGKVISDEYEISNLSSRWPAILSNDGNLVVQVSPGSNDIQIDARATDQLSSIRYEKISNIWPDLEYWGIQPRHHLRIIRMEGERRTDLSQVNAPRRMRETTGFVLTENDELKLIEEQRGSVQQYSSKFDVSRDIWLNFRGDFYTVADSVRAEVASSHQVASSIPLGEVRVNGNARLIVYDDSSEERHSSIYLKPNDSYLSSIAKVARAEPLPPNTWSVDAESLNARLHLPPGWMMLWSNGVDEVEGSWLSKWGIWDVFIVLLLLCLVWGLGGWKWTAIVAGTVLISYQLDNAPTFGWVVLAAICYALKAIKHVRLNQIATVSFWVVFFVVAAACVFHATISMRNALHPQLAAESPTFEESVATSLARRFTAEDIELMGISDLSDFFRRSQERFNSTAPQMSASFATGDELRAAAKEALSSGVRSSLGSAEEVVTTGSYMPSSDPTALISKSRLGQESGELGTPTTLEPRAYDPTLPIAIQTGPGKPSWHWQTVSLNWDGPVAQDQKMTLVLLGPWFTRLLYIFSALATLFVLTYFLYLKVPGIKNVVKSVLPGTSGIASLVFLAVLFNPQDVHADIPDADLLKELESRLLALPDCLNECAYLEEAKVTLTDGVLTIEMQIHAEDRVAIPLPNENSSWNLVDVRQGANQLPLLRERSRLYTLLDKGVHDIILTANVAGLDQFDIGFELIPGHLVIVTPNWRVEGLIRGQVGDRKLTFYREQSAPMVSPNQTTTNFAPLEITPYVSVLRQIILSYEPTLITRVARVAPYAEEFTVRIPLLPNEQVTTAGMSVEDEHMVVTLRANQGSTVWESKLQVDSTIELSAPSIAERTERWSIVGSDFWSYDYDGVVPIDEGEDHTMFVPRSNEILRVEVQQTQPVPGESITISSVDAFHNVDSESTTTTLGMTILASQPGDIEITLPPEASIESLLFAGEFQSLPSSNVVLLPIQPGNHRYALNWKTDRGVSVVYSPPSASFSQPAVNTSTDVQLPENRWILWLAGSSLGSTVAFWSVLVGVILAAIVVSRIPNFTLSTREAVILAAGASLVDLNLLVVVGIWFLAIWLKARTQEEITRPWLYRVEQLVLCGVTLLALYVLVSTIVTALTNDPNMYIVGSNYANDRFTWFSDEITGAVPTPWILSVPIWVYFVLILVWVMWLVFTLLQWMRAWWESLKTPVLWIPINYRGTFSKLKLGRQKHAPIVESTTESETV
ncbi:MAG: hypothetical protein F4X56_01820 [Gammaproteobacteria bacterium]|nr:hypothetical protein [Gammaproteobacteria bacterium]